MIASALGFAIAPYVILGIPVLAFAYFCIWALCASAAMGDDAMDEALYREQRKDRMRTTGFTAETLGEDGLGGSTPGTIRSPRASRRGNASGVGSADTTDQTPPPRENVFYDGPIPRRHLEVARSLYPAPDLHRRATPIDPPNGEAG